MTDRLSLMVSPYLSRHFQELRISDERRQNSVTPKNRSKSPYLRGYSEKVRNFPVKFKTSGSHFLALSRFRLLLVEHEILFHTIILDWIAEIPLLFGMLSNTQACTLQSQTRPYQNSVCTELPWCNSWSGRKGRRSEGSEASRQRAKKWLCVPAVSGNL